MCRLINWWIDTILQVWTVATFSLSCCSLPVPILSIHLTTESFLLYLFPHCLRKVLLIFIGNRQRCLQATLQKRKKKKTLLFMWSFRSSITATLMISPCFSSFYNALQSTQAMLPWQQCWNVELQVIVYAWLCKVCKCVYAYTESFV